MRQRRHRRLPYLLNTRYTTEKGASHARLLVEEERKKDLELANSRPLTIEEHTAQRRYEEELALAKLRELRAEYEVHVRRHGR